MTDHRKPKVLVVDDHAPNVEILEILLDERYDLSVAYSGEEALEVFARTLPDVVLLDVMMPGIDGHETCRRLRETPEGRRASILMVSAKAMGSERRQGLDAGADDYVTKPFMESDLLDRLDAFVRLDEADGCNESRLEDGAEPSVSRACRDLIERRRDERDAFERKVLEAKAIRRGRASMAETVADLGPMLTRIVENASRRSVGRGIDLRADVAVGLPVRADVQRLEIAVAVLLDHAIAHCRLNRVVTLEAHRSVDAVRVRVRWTAGGTSPVDPGSLDSIRELDVTDHQRNLLMDLVLARDVVHAFGGSLEFHESDASDARLEVSFPLAQSTAVPT